VNKAHAERRERLYFTLDAKNAFEFVEDSIQERKLNAFFQNVLKCTYYYAILFIGWWVLVV